MEREVWRVLAVSVSWFNLIDNQDFIKKCFQEKDEYKLDRLVNVFHNLQWLDEKVSDRIADLLNKFVDCDLLNQQFQVMKDNYIKTSDIENIETEITKFAN